MENVQVISADSHVVEPTDVWETRLDRKFRDGRRESSAGCAELWETWAFPDSVGQVM
jgi:hypothetical protein